MGFCILGILGSCSAKQKSKEVSTAETNSFISFVSSHINKIATILNVSAINYVTLVAQGKKSSDIHDIIIHQDSSVDQNLRLNMSNSFKSDDSVNKIVQFLAKQALNAKNKFSGGNATQLTNVEQHVVNNIRTVLKTSTKNINITKIMTSSINKIILKADKGDQASISNIKLDQIAKISAKQIVDKYINAISTVTLSANIKEQLDLESKIEQHTNSIINSFINSIMKNIYSVIIICVIILLIIIGIIYLRKKYA